MVENISFEELSSEINAEFEESKPLDLDLDPTTAFAVQLLEKVKADNDETEANIAEMLEGIDPTANANMANAFKATASGEIVRVDDVSPIEHTAKAKVYSKNLFEPPQERTLEGVTITVDTDGTVHLNGTCTASGNAQYSKVLERAGTYYIADFATGVFPSDENARVHVYDYTNIVGLAIKNNEASNAVRGNEYKAGVEVWFRIRIEQGHTYNDCTLKPTLFYEEQPTEYVPYIDPMTVTVTRYGADETDNAQTFTPSADGTVEIPSISPCMTLLTDTEGVNITLDYNQDSNAFKANVKADLQELDKATAELATNMGDVEAALDELHAYAQALVNGGATE